MKRKAAPKQLPVAVPPPRLPLVIPSASDLEKAAATNVANLTDVRVLAERQMSIEDEIAALNLKLADAAARLKQLREVDLPSAFDAAGIKSCELPGGIKVKVDDFINGYIKEENAQVAFAWLRKHKFGSLIKNTIQVAFGMGDDKKAKQLAAFLKKGKIAFGRKEAVHPSTLRAFVREQLTAGKGLTPAIEVHRVPTATIIRPKE